MKNKMSDTEFIQGKRTESYINRKDPLNGVNNLFIEITKEGEKREYSLVDFLNYVLEAHYLAIDKTKDFSQRLKIVFDAKREVIHYMGEFQEEIDTSLLKTRVYDFGGVLKQVDSTIDKLKLDLDLQKFELEVKKLETETKRYREWMFVGIFLLTAVNTGLLAYGTFSKTQTAENTPRAIPQKNDIPIIKKQ